MLYVTRPPATRGTIISAFCPLFLLTQVQGIDHTETRRVIIGVPSISLEYSSLLWPTIRDRESNTSNGTHGKNYSFRQGTV